MHVMLTRRGTRSCGTPSIANDDRLDRETRLSVALVGVFIPTYATLRHRWHQSDRASTVASLTLDVDSTLTLLFLK